MNRGVRPARPVAPIAVAIAVVALWWLVAHNGGSGWVQALGDVVFGALLIGIVGPAVVLASAKIRVVDAPADGVAGVPIELGVESSTRLRVRPAGPFGDEVLIGPVEGARTAPGRITLRPGRRGVHTSVNLDIATAAPFALQWWTRRVVLPLPAALHIAPRRGQPQPLASRSHDDEGESVEWSPSDVGQPRGARPYRPGDNRRHVHWRATAHTGELMVRELERPSAEPVTVTVVLPDNLEEAERVAERSLGTIVRLLDQGAPVLPSTVDANGPVLALVGDRREAGRRLARAIPARWANSTSSGRVERR